MKYVACQSVQNNNNNNRDFLVALNRPERLSNHTLKVAELAFFVVFFPNCGSCGKEEWSGTSRRSRHRCRGEHVCSSGHVTCFHLLLCEGGGYSQRYGDGLSDAGG